MYFPTPTFPTTLCKPFRENKITIILGIDPGSRITGYGVIEVKNNRHLYIASGCIRLGDAPMDERLQKIFAGISEIIARHNPAFGAIEQIFMHRNPGSALKLGQARGSAMVAIAQQGIPVAEYSARQVKQSVVGYGAATKSQVQHMVKTLLSLSGTPQADAADALAIALCHAQHQRLKKQLSES